MSDVVRSSIKQLDWSNFLNRGLQYGDGLFETMRVVKGIAPFWSLHWQRLQMGADRLALDLPDEAEIKEQVLAITEGKPLAVVKLMLFRQPSLRGYAAKHGDSDWVMQASTLPEYNDQPLRLGVAEMRLAVQPALAGIKHLNRLEQVFLAGELAASDFDEMVVCSHEGYVVESVSQNIVWLKGEQFYTPNVTQCGIKGVGLSWLRGYVEVKTVEIKAQEMMQFEAMFLVNSVRGVSVVESVEGVKKFSTSSPLHDKIKRLWSESTNL